MKMFFALALLIFSLSAPVVAADFKPYPGARVDEAATQAVRQDAAQSPLQLKEMLITIYLTDAPFEKVAAFYRGLGREYRMPGRQGQGPEKLPGGQELKAAYFIFDSAPDLVASRRWAKVQRPFIGDIKMTGRTPQYQDVREVTVIILSEEK